MISNYNNFSLDILLEKAINESFLYYSPNVRKALTRMKDNDIATELLGSEGNDVKPDMTFIDLGKEGYLSFITMRNAKNLLTTAYPSMDWAEKIDTEKLTDYEDYSNELHELDDTESSRGSGVFKKSRNEVGLGRFVNKLFPGKYNSKQVEDFVNSFKASLEKAGESFELVEGEEIEFWYNSENYKEKSGTLGNSCMAQKRNIFGIYTENKDVCRMLILKEDDKLIGRALVWKLNTIKAGSKDIEEAPEYFMDRQYTINESDVDKFRNYAKEKGWSYKPYNNHHSYGTININGENKNLDLTIQVIAKDYRKYPYMDTFKRYNPETGILHNDDEDDSDYEGQYILDDTTGGYTEIEGGVYSEWHDRRISEDDAVWSTYLGDWLLETESVFVSRPENHRGWYPTDYDDIYYDEDLDEYINVDDAVWSQIEDRFMFSESAVEVVNKIYDDGDVPNSDDKYMYEGSDDITEIDTDWLWFDKISDKFRDWREYRYISKKLLVIDYKGNYIPKKFATEAYKIEPRDNAVDITGVEYLCKADSLALGYNIIETEKRTTDWFTYTETISEYTDILLERLPKLIDRYSDVLNNKGQLQLQFSEDQQEYRDKVSMNMALCDDRLENLETEMWN
jgi:hypothetical protein